MHKATVTVAIALISTVLVGCTTPEEVTVPTSLPPSALDEDPNLSTRTSNLSINDSPNAREVFSSTLDAEVASILMLIEGATRPVPWGPATLDLGVNYCTTRTNTGISPVEFLEAYVAAAQQVKDYEGVVIAYGTMRSVTAPGSLCPSLPELSSSVRKDLEDIVRQAYTWEDKSGMDEGR